MTDIYDSIGQPEDAAEQFSKQIEMEKKYEVVEKKDLTFFQNAVELSMRDKHTRHFIREILSWCGLLDGPVVNKERVLIAEGKRALGWEIKVALDQVDKKIYPQLLLEGVEYEKALYQSEKIPV